MKENKSKIKWGAMPNSSMENPHREMTGGAELSGWVHGVWALNRCGFKM